MKSKWAGISIKIYTVFGDWFHREAKIVDRVAVWDDGEYIGVAERNDQGGWMHVIDIPSSLLREIE